MLGLKLNHVSKCGPWTTSVSSHGKLQGVIALFGHMLDWLALLKVDRKLDYESLFDCS